MKGKLTDEGCLPRRLKSKLGIFWILSEMLFKDIEMIMQVFLFACTVLRVFLSLLFYTMRIILMQEDLLMKKLPMKNLKFMSMAPILP